MSRYALTTTVDGKQSVVVVDNEAFGRNAWLVARQVPGCTFASLSLTSGPLNVRTRCEWSYDGMFVDRTDAHRAEIESLCVQLSAQQSAHKIAVCEEVKGSPVVLMTGRERRRALSVSYTTADQVRAHWQGYVPAEVA